MYRNEGVPGGVSDIVCGLIGGLVLVLVWGVVPTLVEVLAMMVITAVSLRLTSGIVRWRAKLPRRYSLGQALLRIALIVAIVLLASMAVELWR